MYFIEFENEKASAVFIALNLTVAFLLIRKILDEWLASKVGRWEILRNGGILVIRDDF